MTITFADGTRIEVSASAFDDFLKYDLKWVEFVHGRVSETQRFTDTSYIPEQSAQQNMQRCPSRSC